MVNQIKVEVSEVHLRNDEDIARAVVNVLNWDLMVPDEKIKVDVHEGWIILEGTVDHKHQRKAAENAIRNITGVKGVTNLINLKPEIMAPGVRIA